jgi:cobalt-zinc-cadmium efflux system outer membrane protein
MITPHSTPIISCVLLAGALTGCVATRADYENRRSTWERMHSEREVAAAPEAEEIGEEADLPQLLLYARAHNPGLEAAFLRWKAALERVPQATTLPNPRLSFGGYLSEVETRTGPMEARVGLAQPLPWFGKLELAGNIAFEASEASRKMLEAERLDLDQRVRDAWYEYAWLEQAVLITAGNLELLAHWESVARALMETGLGRHSDVIRAQVELGKLEDRVQTLGDLRRPLVAKLNAALNRPSGAALPRPTFPLPAPPDLDEHRLLSELRATNPLLAALEHRVESARSGTELADKAFYPDFFVGADYTFIGSAENPGVSGSGDDALALTLGFDLPIWRSKIRAGVREAEARMRGAHKELEELRNRLSSDLEMALYQLRDARRRVELFRDSLIPKGEESIQALDTAYQSGDAGFLDLIDAQRVLLEFQLQAARAEADRAQALAETERITGISLHQEL